MCRSREALLGSVVELACDAGESGYPLLETALDLIIRGADLSRGVKTLLAMVGQGILLAAEESKGVREDFITCN